MPLKSSALCFCDDAYSPEKDAPRLPPNPRASKKHIPKAQRKILLRGFLRACWKIPGRCLPAAGAGRRGGNNNFSFWRTLFRVENEAPQKGVWREAA
jgi:hypothetical protein